MVCVNGQGCNNISELFDFNRTTGVVSNLLKLRTDSVAIGLYGASFSSDNSKLYISSWMNTNRVYQYDLSSGVPSVIVNSKVIVGNANGGPWFMGMQLGPDGKIYIAVRNQMSIAVINYPNLAGISCNLVDAVVSLNGKVCGLALPNFVDFFDYSNTEVSCLTGMESSEPGNMISISPNPFSDQSTLRAKFHLRNATLIIRNCLGQEVKGMRGVSGRDISLNCENFESGVYFIEISDSNTIYTSKFVINKH